MITLVSRDTSASEGGGREKKRGARATPLIKLSIAFLSRNAIIFIRAGASVTFARGQLVGNYTRLSLATRKENKKKKRYEGKREKEREGEGGCRAALKVCRKSELIA